MPSPYLTLYVGITLLAINGLFAKGISMDVMDITQLRSTIAALAIGIYCYWGRRQTQPLNKSTLAGIYGLGMLMGLHWASFFHSMQITTVAIGMISFYTFPIMVIFIEAAIHRRWPQRKDIVCALLVFTGIGVMAGDEITSANGETLTGIGWGLVSAFLFNSRNILQKYYFAAVRSDTLMLHQVIAIALMLLPFIRLEDVTTIAIDTWLKLIALGIVTTAGAHTLIVYSYKHLPLKTVAMISCLQPVIGAILAWIVINEQPSVYIVVGGGVILTVAVYESLRSQTQGYAE